MKEVTLEKLKAEAKAALDALDGWSVGNGYEKEVVYRAEAVAAVHTALARLAGGED